MVGRRTVLRAIPGLAISAMAAPAAGAAGAGDGGPRWARYRDAMAIDGLGGPALLHHAPGTADYAADLQAVRDSGLRGAITTVAPQGRFWFDDAALAATRERIAAWRAIVERHPDDLLLVRDGGDLAEARSARKFGLILGFQGTEPFGEDLDRVGAFREQGLRVVQLTHNRRNLVGDGCMEPGNAGLSTFGRAMVERLNAERLVVDLSHGSQRTIREGILASKAPVLIGHAGCRALADAPRLVHDAELRLMADRGGVVGIIFWPYLREWGQQTAADVIRHVEHAIRVCGEAHVGIGTDLGIAPVPRTPEAEAGHRALVRSLIDQGILAADRSPDLTVFVPDLNTANWFEVLAAMLSARGHGDDRIERILGGNFARVMADVWG